MEGKVIAALIGLIGISLGAFFGGIGFYLKTRSERLQAKKLVLFHLLEIRHILKSSYADPKEITAEYLKFCKSYFLKLGLNDDECPDELRVLIENHMASLLKKMTPQISLDFINSYENSLKSLCQDNPILAFKLSGKERLTKVITAQEDYINSFTNLEFFSSSPQGNEFISKELNKVSNKATEEIIKDIDKDISLTSRHCGIFVWFNCRSIIKQKSKPKVCFKDMGVENLLEQAFKELLESTKKLNEQSAVNLQVSPK